MQKMQFLVRGMTCVLCSHAIEKKLAAFSWINNISIALNTGTVFVEGDFPPDAAQRIQNAVHETGYATGTQNFSIRVAEMRVEPDQLRQYNILHVDYAAASQTLQAEVLAGSLSFEDWIDQLNDLSVKINPQDLQDADHGNPAETSNTHALSKIITGAVTGLVLMILMHSSLSFAARSIISLVLASPIFFILSRDIFFKASSSLRNKILNMDVMYAMGMGISYGVSLMATLQLLDHQFLFYETAVFLATFLRFGRYLEARASKRTNASLNRLLTARPKTVHILEKSEVAPLQLQLPEQKGLAMAVAAKVRDTFPEFAAALQTTNGDGTAAGLSYGENHWVFHSPDDVVAAQNEIRAAIWRQIPDVELAVQQLQPGMWIRIKPGETIPTDGRIIWGESDIDEAMISGESLPVFKTMQDSIIGGTINLNGIIEAEVLATGSDTLVAKIAREVEQAQLNKATIQQLADKLVARFIPLVILITLLIAGYWTLVNPMPAAFVFNVVVSVLVVACPCALGLATPAAITTAIGKAAEMGILVKGGAFFEIAATTKTLLWDKTGTLTTGDIRVASVFPAAKQDEIIMLAASAEQYATHPIAQAILHRANASNTELWPLAEYKVHIGKGVEGRLFGDLIYVGKPGPTQAGFSREQNAFMRQELRSGKTVIAVQKNTDIVGLISLEDRLRPDIEPVLKSFKARGLRSVMVTGDNHLVANAVAEKLSINSIHAEKSPLEKSGIVAAEQPPKAFIGDGSNDAPAMAKADVGIAFANATEIAIEAGDVVILNQQPASVLTFFAYAKRVMQQIRLNLFWAILYNALLIPAASGIFYQLTGHAFKPEWAGLAMALSSVSVVTFSLTLHSWRPPETAA
jgi:heavy metal translocating P-type ATPase